MEFSIRKNCEISPNTVRSTGEIIAKKLNLGLWKRVKFEKVVQIPLVIQNTVKNITNTLVLGREGGTEEGGGLISTISSHIIQYFKKPCLKFNLCKSFE